MKKDIHVLTIDDHAVVAEGYQTVFKNLDAPVTFVFAKAHDCRSGYELILSREPVPFDIAIVDYSMPPYPEMSLHNGIDMALLLRQVMPNCKIIMMTMHKEASIISSILKKINPEGFINKSDCSTDELLEGFNAVLNNSFFYSDTIQTYINQQEQGAVLEEIDIAILRLLAKGIKNKNLDKYIPLSANDIENRKSKIKQLLDVKNSDEELIIEARKRGYI